MNAIDQLVDEQHREWVRKFTWHLDLIPHLMDALIMLTLPTIPVSRGGSRFDRAQVTGGGFIDNIPLDVFDVTGDGHLVKGGAEADARELWSWVVAYTRAVAEWTGEQAPVLAEKPDADPLTARAIALTTAGWLIDRADDIEPVTELDEHRETMFALIRRLRGVYGVHPHPRTPRAMCTTCGARGVVVGWVTAENGRASRVAACKVCGETYTPSESGVTPAVTLDSSEMHPGGVPAINGPSDSGQVYADGMPRLSEAQ